MNEFLMRRSTAVSIANAIRTKGGASGEITGDEFAAKILAIPQNGGATPLQTKTVNPALEDVVVTPDSGYALSQVTVNAMPQTEQATPALTNNAGSIIASVTQTAGYVQAGVKSGVLELDKLAAHNYPLSETEQTIPADKYLTGAQTISPVTGAGLAALNHDFIAANIKEGVDLFGVVGTLSGGGGAVPGSFSYPVYVRRAYVNTPSKSITFDFPSDFTANINCFAMLRTNGTSTGRFEVVHNISDTPFNLSGGFNANAISQSSGSYLVRNNLPFVASYSNLALSITLDASSTSTQFEGEYYLIAGKTY